MRNIYLQKRVRPFLLFFLICLSTYNAEADLIPSSKYDIYTIFRIDSPQLQVKPSLVGANWVSWAPVAGVTGYVLEMSNTGAPESFVPIKTFSGTARSYRHTGLYYSQKVYYRLKAIGSGNDVAYSNIVSATTHPQGKVFNIMPLGDSNTEGGTGSQPDAIKAAYRAKLEQLLNASASKGKYDFVGSEQSGQDLMTDVDHAGFGGATIQNITDLLRDRSYGQTSNSQGLTYLQEHQPDVILLHIGTNAVDGTDAGMVKLEALLDEIDKYENTSGKDVTVILAKIIRRVCYEKGCPYPTESEATIEYNNKMEVMAQRRQASGDNLLLVDMQDGAGIVYRWGDDGGDMQDPLHPNQAGYDKMAPVWFEELDKLLNVEPVSPPDTQAPETTIATKPAALTNSTSATFTFTSSEGNVVYMASINGGAYAEVGSPYTVNNLSDGVHTIEVKAKDAAGNIDESPARYTWTVDTKAPAAPVLQTPAENTIVNNNKPGISGTAEANSTIAILNGSTQIGAVKAGADGNWSFTPATALPEGIQQIAARATDEAGNTGTVSSVRRFTIDTKAPETTIVTKPAAISNQRTADFTFSANEENVAFEVSINGGAYIAAESPYTLNGLADGKHTLSVRSTDAAGNTESTPATHTWTIDTQAPAAPVLASITEDRGPEPGDQVTADNSLVLKGTAEAKSEVQLYSGETAIGKATANSSGEWEFDYTSTKLIEGTHTFAAVATDVAGNTGQKSTGLEVTIDLTAPEAAISTSSKSYVNKAFEVEVRFTEQIYGLAASDFSVTNGTLTGLESINSTTYKATLTPAADGLVKLSLIGNSVTDLAGNPNAASEGLEVTYDGTKPQLSINSDAAAVTNKPFTVSFTFSEDVTGFEVTDVEARNAAISGFAAQSARVYTLLVTPAADGEVSINVNADKTFDAAGNGNEAAAIFTRIYDAKQPGVVLSTAAANPVNKAFTVQVDFSERISGFELGDIAVSNGVASQLSKANDQVYTFRVTPAANGEVSVSVAADKVQDIAENGNTASNQLKRLYDAAQPEIILATDAPSPANKPFVVRIKLSEPVTDFNLDAIAISNGAASDLQKVSDTEYKSLITPAKDGNVSIQVPENEVHDSATNGNIASNQLAILYDATAPEKYKVKFTVKLVDVTNQAAVALEVDGAETGSTYFYSISSSNGNAAVKGSATVNASDFTITGINVTELEDGLLTVSFYLVDEAGNEGKAATDQVEKLTRNITAVDQPQSIKVPFRTEFNKLPLPDKVRVTYATQEQENLKVTWQKGNYNGLVPGKYELTGVLELAPKTSNTEGKTASITVEVEPNKTPTALTLSSDAFKPDIKPAEVIGTFSTTDPDDDEFTYTLVAGQGDTDNSLFEILNNNELHLKSNRGLYGKTSFSIRVQSMDPYQNVISKAFILTKTPFNNPDIKLVNAFTPDGDGINDTWTVPELRFYNNVEVEVFNRAGIRVFHTFNPEQGWDGRGADGSVVEGSYFYVIQIKDLNQVQKGVVTVLK